MFNFFARDAFSPLLPPGFFQLGREAGTWWLCEAQTENPVLGDVPTTSSVVGMREKSVMDGASEELERRSRYLSSLIERTKVKGDAKQEEEKREKEKEKGRDDGRKIEDDLKEMENIRVRAADMPRELQWRAFLCARETLNGMPKLDSKRLALVLKKTISANIARINSYGFEKGINKDTGG